jgi:hypothetical protein
MAGRTHLIRAAYLHNSLISFCDRISKLTTSSPDNDHLALRQQGGSVLRLVMALTGFRNRGCFLNTLSDIIEGSIMQESYTISTWI